jgi:broad specificity phosphatase PhoE
MPALYLVRHGRAAAGWDTAVDPPLDTHGVAQAEHAAHHLCEQLVGRPVRIVTSPLRRCRETASAFERLVAASGSAPAPVHVQEQIAEIPSPQGVAIAERVTWLRRVMQGTWTELVTSDGRAYEAFHRTLVQWARDVNTDTVAFSHFIAINAIIGAATGDDRVVIRRLDNASITRIDVSPTGELSFVSGGNEADTLIR